MSSRVVPTPTRRRQMIARNSMQPEWLRIAAATDNFGISRSGIYRLAADGEIELRKCWLSTWFY
jgi:hypothetical protein